MDPLNTNLPINVDVCFLLNETRSPLHCLHYQLPSSVAQRLITVSLSKSVSSMSGRESSDSGPGLAAGAATGADLEQPLNITVKPAVQFLGDPSDTYKMRGNPRGWVRGLFISSFRLLENPK